MSVSPIPEGFRSVSAHLVVDDGHKLIDFYGKAFGAETMIVMPGPGGQGVMHAEVKIGDTMVMLAEEFPGNPMKSPNNAGTTTVALMIYTEDVDAAFGRAVEAGATVAMPPMDMFWGDRYCKVIDPAGHHWEIATHIEDVAPEEMGKRAEEFFKNFQPGGDCPPPAE